MQEGKQELLISLHEHKKNKTNKNMRYNMETTRQEKQTIRNDAVTGRTTPKEAHNLLFSITAHKTQSGNAFRKPKHNAVGDLIADAHGISRKSMRQALTSCNVCGAIEQKLNTSGVCADCCNAKQTVDELMRY